MHDILLYALPIFVACMLGECVRSQTVKFRAVYAAAPPVIEINRPMARRRIRVRADC